MSGRLWSLAAALGAVTLVVATLAGCGLWGPEGGPGGAGMAVPTVSATDVAVDATLGADGVQRIEISAGDDLRFNPIWVRARPGVIEFVFRNTGTTPHAVEVDVGGPAASGTPTAGGGSDPGAVGTGNLNGGQSQTVRVSVDRPGRYPFPCVYHVSSGMQGTLEVVATTGGPAS